MSEHTPGPWEYDEPPNWHGLAARVFHRNGEKYEPIAQVQISGWPKRQALANCRLIAAAPEMLAELHSIASLATNAWNDPPTVAAFFKDIVARCHAAIAKAEGR